MEIDGDEGARAFGDVEMPTGHVPLAALHAERGRRQAAERARDELLAQLNGGDGDGDNETDEPAEAPDVDWGEDDEGLADPSTGDLAELNDHLNASEAMARSSFGDEAVDAAEAWAERAMREDPSLAAEVLSHPNPYAFALGFAMSAGGRGGPAIAAPRPPRSLATLPSAGGAAHVPAGPGQAYDSVFGG